MNLFAQFGLMMTYSRGERAVLCSTIMIRVSLQRDIEDYKN